VKEKISSFAGDASEESEERAKETPNRIEEDAD